MPGRRAMPWSAEAEEELPIRPGRRKTLWRDRPKHFTTLAAAGTFAARRADMTRRRQRVRFQTSEQGGPVWIVRPGTEPIRSSLYASLARMEREA